MNNIDNISDVSIIIKIIELISIILCTYYTYVKISNIEKLSTKKTIIITLSAVFIPIFANIIERMTNFYYGKFLIVFFIVFINIVVFKESIFGCTIVTTIALSISYVLYVISLMLSFIPIAILQIRNDYLSLTIILIVYFITSYNTIRIKKLKYGLSFLRNKLSNTYTSILIVNIGAITLFSYMVLKSHDYDGSGILGIGCIVFSIIMFFTIKQSFDLYYKQKLLTKDLEETKKELEAKKKEVEQLEEENLNFSKSSHSLAHKQKALEFKLEQLMKVQIDEESKKSIKEEIEDLNKEVYKEPGKVGLVKTGIESIDNMLSYMQSECINDNIEFELQVSGNIYYMINNLITENDLEILMADHIKDAIFAINFSDNSNRSILIRIGKIDNIYSLYIYDSGIEFSKEVLDNLGKKPITTHEENGGTGMGFMNTFDTLNKTKASLIINEIGKPCEDNYTKVLIFKFDNKNEFKVNSYKDEVLV